MINFLENRRKTSFNYPQPRSSVGRGPARQRKPPQPTPPAHLPVIASRPLAAWQSRKSPPPSIAGQKKALLFEKRTKNFCELRAPRQGFQPAHFSPQRRRACSSTPTQAAPGHPAGAPPLLRHPASRLRPLSTDSGSAFPRFPRPPKAASRYCDALPGSRRMVPASSCAMRRITMRS